MLSRCRKYGIILNKDKFVPAVPSVSFCGYKLSAEGVAADEDRVSAIRDFPTPANLTDLRSFMGLVNQLSEFTPDIAAAAQSLRPLMSSKRAFTWTSDHDEAFRRVKTALLQPPVLAHLDPALPVILQTDVSRLKEKISPYLFTTVGRAGKQLCILDALSRAPVSLLTPEDEAMGAEAAAHLRSVVSTNTIKTPIGPYRNFESRQLRNRRTSDYETA